MKIRSQGLPNDSWFRLLEHRLGADFRVKWEGMWEVEQLIMALNLYSREALLPEDREMNQTTGWNTVKRIVGDNIGDPPPVVYAWADEHPWWLEPTSDDVDLNGLSMADEAPSEMV